MEMKSSKIEMPTSFDDLSLGVYLQFMEKAKDIKGDGSINDEIISLKLIEILTGASEEDIDAVQIAEMKIMAEKLKVLIDQMTEFDGVAARTIEIEGITYVAKDYNHLDNGEYISLNLLQERYGSNNIEAIPMMLAILVRPGTKKYDFEKGVEYWEIEPFSRRDTENMEFRANLFKTKAKAKDLMPLATFFLSGKEKLEKTTQTFSQEE